MSAPAAATIARAQAAAVARAYLPARRFGNRYDYHYVRAKLGSDPLYPAVLTALRDCHAPLLDIGCGLGLLAHALRADGQAIRYRGIDIDARKVARAQRSAHNATLADTSFASVDLSRDLPDHRGSVAILDVLQYLDADIQARLLEAAIGMLIPGARLVIRAALRDDSARARATRVTDWIGHLSGWMQSRPRCYPDRDALRARFDAAGLRSHFAPLYGRTPFNHWLVSVDACERPRWTRRS